MVNHRVMPAEGDKDVTCLPSDHIARRRRKGRHGRARNRGLAVARNGEKRLSKKARQTKQGQQEARARKGAKAGKPNGNADALRKLDMPALEN